MSSEIDFSLFIAALRRRWWIILLCLAIALAIGVGIGLAQARPYEAANTLLVQSPRYQWRFAGEITAITDQRRDFQREVLAIARSNEIAQAAVEALDAGGLEPATTPQALTSAVNVRAGDGNTIVVTATSDDAERAAAYARAWTEALMDAARDVYGAVEDLAIFQVERDLLEAELQTLESALAEARARTGVYSNSSVPDEVMRPSLNLQQLNQVNETLSGYLVAIQNLRLVQEALATATTETDLTQLPWELLGGPILNQRGVVSPDIARATLSDPARLAGLLEREASSLHATAGALENRADQLQAALAADWQDFEDVLRLRNQARETYQVVNRKVNELLLQERLDPSLLTIVGSPEPLVTHVRAPMLGLLATAAVAGLIVGVFLAVWLELSSRKQAPPPAPALQ
jgi:capsular polysaccharide biosynthesis protein